MRLMINGLFIVTVACLLSSFSLGLANPAATYCEQNQGEYRIKDGVCVFGDKSECDGFAYLRKECAPGDCKSVENQKCNKE